MVRDYKEIIQKLNSGEIEEILFSINNYTHYSNCSIKRCVNLFNNSKQIVCIKVKLVKDNSETVSFFQSFNEDFKLFKIAGKGKFTLKQIWHEVRIKQIRYANWMLWRQDSLERMAKHSRTNWQNHCLQRKFSSAVFVLPRAVQNSNTVTFAHGAFPHIRGWQNYHMVLWYW